MTSDAEELLSNNLLPWVNEKDVPGASLCGRDPSTLTIPQLKCWLQCWQASLKGKKPDLIARLDETTWYIANTLCHKSQGNSLHQKWVG